MERRRGREGVGGSEAWCERMVFLPQCLGTGECSYYIFFRTGLIRLVVL